jgi:hypothetical protein
VERAAEWYALVTCLIVGLSHVLQPRAWAEVFTALHRSGKPGAFANGGLSLVPGALFVAAHPVWSGPAVVLTVLGWLLVFKGTICLLAPSLALRSMGRAGAGKGREFVLGGLLLLGIAGVLGYALWAG